MQNHSTLRRKAALSVKMGKGFKLIKLSQVIPSFKSCCSKDPSTLPSNPVPSFLRLPHPFPPPPPVNPTNIMSFNPHYNLPSPLSSIPTPPPPSNPLHYSSIRRHVSSALACGSRSRSETDHARSPPPPPQEEEAAAAAEEEEYFHWENEEKFHVVAKNITSTLSVPRPPNTEKDEKTKKKKRCRTKHKKKTTKPDHQHTSETETLVEKRSTAARRTKRRVLGRRRRKSSDGSEDETPARLSKFQWMIPCAVEGKVRESFAVVKRSEDPYEDFKRSMMEMVVEKGMSEEEDLEQLLHCFLSLNDRDHHGIIVRAFCEVCHALFVYPV